MSSSDINPPWVTKPRVRLAGCDDDDECSAPPRVTDSPADLWLVYGELEHDDTHWNCCREGEVSWCEDKQYDSDVHYVRGDRYDDAMAALIGHRTEIARLRNLLRLVADEPSIDKARALADAELHGPNVADKRGSAVLRADSA